MNTYTSLFLDLDNTLFDFNMAESVSIRKVLKKHNLPFDDFAVNTYSNINRTFWKKFEKGEIEKKEIFEGRFKALLNEFKLSGDTKEISIDYFTELSESYYTVEGTFDILNYLKSNEYKLYATTNGISLTQFKRIKGSGLDAYFDGVFVSEDAHHQKPEKEYFDYVINHIPEKNKSRILIIGDSQSSDILGGINSGIDTCWYNPNFLEPSYNSKFVIHSLKELKEIL